MIIGITGTYGSGKTTIIDYLLHKGFKHYSMSGFIREVLEKENLPINRDNLITMANKLRKEHHLGYIAEQVYNRASKEGKNCVIESIRTEGEVKTLKSKDNFVLISINANIKKRYQRVFERKGEKDSVSFERFQEQEQGEMTSTDPTKQNLRRCIELADYKITNNGSLEELKEKVEELIKKILGQKTEEFINKIRYN